MIVMLKYPLALFSLYLWIGFVCAISFMEAWLKFRAPGVTLPIGLGIGRLVFNALNKMEWLFAIGIILVLLLAKAAIFSTENISLAVPLLILIVQTAWLLPALDGRAEMHIQGKTVPASNLHFYYVAMELIKIISLFIFSFKFIK